MNNIKLIISYEFKIKLRRAKTFVKNYFTTLIGMIIVFAYMIFQFGKIVTGNLELINRFSSQIFSGISIMIIINILINKKSPLQWHPASMIYLSGSNFTKVLKMNLLKKTILYGGLSLLVALIMSFFKSNFITIQIFLSFWNLLMISLVSRYYIYNKGINIKILSFIFVYIIILNFQLYGSKYIGIILILFLSSISIVSIKEIINISLDFDKSFNEMNFINRANYLARHAIISDMQEMNREKLAEKARRKSILKNIKFKNPLYEKNIITFSRINTSITMVLFTILIITIVFYKF